MRFELYIIYVASVFFILSFVSLLWYGLWKLILEKNPLVRDFFDLDHKKKNNAKRS
jgi:hypothetical protein